MNASGYFNSAWRRSAGPFAGIPSKSTVEAFSRGLQLGDRAVQHRVESPQGLVRVIRFSHSCAPVAAFGLIAANLLRDGPSPQPRLPCLDG